MHGPWLRRLLHSVNIMQRDDAEAFWCSLRLGVCYVQLDATEQLELWGLLANMLAVDELVPGQLLGTQLCSLMPRTNL